MDKIYLLFCSNDFKNIWADGELGDAIQYNEEEEYECPTVLVWTPDKSIFTLLEMYDANETYIVLSEEEYQLLIAEYGEY